MRVKFENQDLIKHMSTFSLLCANLGNANLKYFNPRQMNKLVSRNVERRIARRIHHLNPDIIVYQESMGHLEYLGRDPQQPQIRRMLGGAYSILADKRFQFEGIAVKTSVGRIVGCKPGAYKPNPRTEKQGNLCDTGFGTQVATIRLRDGFTFELAAFHLHSVNVLCRVATLDTVFRGNPQENRPPMLQSENILIAGDLNLDPWRENDNGEQSFRAHIARGWAGRPITYHNCLGADGLPEPTSIFPLIRRTIDIVASNFARGTLDTLGVTPGTRRLDGGRGTDHRALFGVLEYQGIKVIPQNLK